METFYIVTVQRGETLLAAKGRKRRVEYVKSDEPLHIGDTIALTMVRSSDGAWIDVSHVIVGIKCRFKTISGHETGEREYYVNGEYLPLITVEQY